MNTTQFGWVLNKLPNKARPMGKVYQPEVAARAILFAAAHNRRSIWVGLPTYIAIAGNKIAPWVGDWVLSRNGYKGQQTNEPEPPDQKNNVWEPVHEDRGAHGDFGNIATNKSFTLWATINRNMLGTIAGATAVAAYIFFRLRKKNIHQINGGTARG
jgi:hypothetical protein